MFILIIILIITINFTVVIIIIEFIVIVVSSFEAQHSDMSCMSCNGSCMQQTPH